MWTTLPCPHPHWPSPIHMSQARGDRQAAPGMERMWILGSDSPSPGWAFSKSHLQKGLSPSELHDNSITLQGPEGEVPLWCPPILQSFSFVQVSAWRGRQTIPSTFRNGFCFSSQCIRFFPQLPGTCRAKATPREGKFLRGAIPVTSDKHSPSLPLLGWKLDALGYSFVRFIV